RDHCTQCNVHSTCANNLCHCARSGSARPVAISAFSTWALASLLMTLRLVLSVTTKSAISLSSEMQSISQPPLSAAHATEISSFAITVPTRRYSLGSVGARDRPKPKAISPTVSRQCDLSLRRPRIFICHSSADIEQIHRLIVPRLEQHGFDSFL